MLGGDISLLSKSERQEVSTNLAWDRVGGTEQWKGRCLLLGNLGRECQIGLGGGN